MLAQQPIPMGIPTHSTPPRHRPPGCGLHSPTSSASCGWATTFLHPPPRKDAMEMCFPWKNHQLHPRSHSRPHHDHKLNVPRCIPGSRWVWVSDQLQVLHPARKLSSLSSREELGFLGFAEHLLLPFQDPTGSLRSQDGGFEAELCSFLNLGGFRGGGTFRGSDPTTREVLLWQSTSGIFWIRFTPAHGSDGEEGRGGKQDGGVKKTPALP